MEESAQVVFSKKTSFEAKNQAVTVTIRLDGCAKKDYRLVEPVVRVLFKEVMTYLES